MAAWDLVKDLKLDLSEFTDTQVQTLINNLETDEIAGILKDLEEAAAKNIERKEWLDLALGIAKAVLTKGVSLV